VGNGNNALLLAAASVVVSFQLCPFICLFMVDLLKALALWKVIFTLYSGGAVAGF